MAPTPPTPDQVPDLIVVRRLLSEGEETVARADDVSVRIGLLQVDLGAEMLIKMGLRHLGIPAKGAELGPLLEALRTAAGTASPVKVGAVTQLRKMRNAVMHDGTTQEPVSARACAGQARDVLHRLAEAVFGVDLGNLRLAEFIDDERVRFFLGEGTRLFEAQDYLGAAGHSIVAFDDLLSLWAVFNQQLFGLTEGPRDPFARIISTLSSGVYLPGLRRFRDATRTVQANASVTRKVSITQSGSWSTRPQQDQERDARYALDFVGGLALQIQGKLAAARG